MVKVSQLALAVLTVMVAGCGTRNMHKEGEQAATAKRDSLAAPSSLTPREELREAMKSMKRVTSYRASADMLVSGQKVRIEGRFELTSVLLIVHRADGKVMIGVAVGDRANVSEDDGATWTVDAGRNIATLSSLITGPISKGDQIPDQGEVTFIGEDDIDGVKTRHFRVGSSDPIDVWVADHAGTQVVRQLKMVVEATDVHADATITYSNWNEPTGIEMPAGAP